MNDLNKDVNQQAASTSEEEGRHGVDRFGGERAGANR